MKTEIAKIINVPVVINNSVQICSKLNIFQHKGEKILNLLEDLHSIYLPAGRVSGSLNCSGEQINSDARTDSGCKVRGS